MQDVPDLPPELFPAEVRGDALPLLPEREAPLDLDGARARVNLKLLQEQSTEVDLANVDFPVLTVSFMEWEEITDSEGRKRVKRRQRMAEIDSYTPMQMLHRMLAERAKVMAGESARDPAANLALMTSAVLWVWAQSEPDMTLDRLQRGLTLKQIQALFFRFFTAELGMNPATE
jgi:hypothetical protein